MLGGTRPEVEQFAEKGEAGTSGLKPSHIEKRLLPGQGPAPPKIKVFQRL